MCSRQTKKRKSFLYRYLAQKRDLIIFHIIKFLKKGYAFIIFKKSDQYSIGPRETPDICVKGRTKIEKISSKSIKNQYDGSKFLILSWCCTLWIRSVSPNCKQGLLFECFALLGRRRNTFGVISRFKKENIKLILLFGRKKIVISYNNQSISKTLRKSYILLRKQTMEKASEKPTEIITVTILTKQKKKKQFFDAFVLALKFDTLKSRHN